MNLEKQRGAQNTINKLIVDDKEITDQTYILECIRELFETLFKKRKQKTEAEVKSFLRHLNIPKLSEHKSKLCEDSLKRMQSEKTPGGLTKKFFETFWNELKEIFVDSLLVAKEKKPFKHISKIGYH